MSYDYTGYIKEISKNIKGETLITIATDYSIGDLASEQGAVDVSIKKHRKKRSLNANSYMWVIVTKIADILREDKEKVYLDMLRHYGQSEYISVESYIDISGFVKYYDFAGTGHVQGKEFNHYKCYKGSSEFDTREMSILIDGVVQEAKQLGIETMPPKDLERLKNAWGK